MGFDQARLIILIKTAPLSEGFYSYGRKIVLTSSQVLEARCSSGPGQITMLPLEVDQTKVQSSPVRVTIGDLHK